MIKGVIFDLDLTLVDTTILENARKMRNWHEAYGLIPYTSMYAGIQEVLDKIKAQGIKDGNSQHLTPSLRGKNR